jgi:hypothetical protein
MHTLLHITVGQVVEILQMIGSPAEQNGKADGVLVAPAIIGEIHDKYCMPRITLLQECRMLHVEVCFLCIYIFQCSSVLVHLALQTISCTVNVQHDCADAQCAVTKCWPVWQEREKTSHLALGVQHLLSDNSSDFVLNTTQMRDAASITPFSATIPVLNRELIIETAAACEVQVAKELRKQQEKATTAQTAKAPSKGKARATE